MAEDIWYRTPYKVPVTKDRPGIGDVVMWNGAKWVSVQLSSVLADLEERVAALEAATPP